jgi:transposase
MNRKIRLQRLAPQDRAKWQALYYSHQKQWQRRRLLALKAIWDGQFLIGVCRTQHVQRKTLETWLDAYLHGGFDALLSPQTRPRGQTLSAQRRKILRHILLHKTPLDYGLDSYVWTATRVQALIEQKWGVALQSSRLYQLFDEFGLSHQRAHRDYGPAKAGERAAFVAELKKKQPNYRQRRRYCAWMSSPSSPSRIRGTPGRRRTPLQRCRAMNGTARKSTASSP